jgi:hypothetical protein
MTHPERIRIKLHHRTEGLSRHSVLGGGVHGKTAANLSLWLTQSS